MNVLWNEGNTTVKRVASVIHQRYKCYLDDSDKVLKLPDGGIIAEYDSEIDPSAVTVAIEMQRIEMNLKKVKTIRRME